MTRLIIGFVLGLAVMAAHADVSAYVTYLHQCGGVSPTGKVVGLQLDEKGYAILSKEAQ